ncbi:MAG: hypothetical protein HY597_02065 [Candidatus Omnitrophica bacterium]|nr:hypothetical protein [Candidatus Omnitrophota bacterium]
MPSSFRSALLLSVTAHAALVCGLPELHRLPHPSARSALEVMARPTPGAAPALKPQPAVPTAPRRSVSGTAKPLATKPAAVGFAEPAAAGRGERLPARTGEGGVRAASTVINPPTIKSVTPTMPADKPVFDDVIDLTNLSQYTSEAPGSLSYYAGVRKRIEYFAYRNGVAVERPLRGRIYVTFTIVSSGHITALRLDRERSDPDAQLQELTLRSLQDAAPFPPFPGSVLQRARTFNILVEYQLVSTPR